MRLLIVSKRRPQQRDLIDRPYGRIHYLATELASLGNQVEVLLCSHHDLPPTHVQMASVDWFSSDVRKQGPLKLYRTWVNHARSFQPDWVIGMSDAQYGWLAQQIARRVNSKFAVDAYDNFESYMPWNLPLHLLWRRSVRDANLVTAAGPQLARLLQAHRKGRSSAEVIPMVADPEFVPLDKLQCRRDLGLSLDATLIGYIGSWGKNRGTAVLLNAFRRIRQLRPELNLLVSGHPPREVLNEPGVIATGYVSDKTLPLVINALDLACVVTAETSFGRYSYPAKLCEAMACSVPIIATATGPVRWMLRENDTHLVRPGDIDAFAKRMLDMLSSPYANYGARETWKAQAEKLAYLLDTAGREN